MIFLMNNWYFLFYAFSLFIPLYMGVMSYLSYRSSKAKEQKHLFELWASLAVNLVLMFIFFGDLTHYAAISMIGWIWPMRAIKLVLEDISGVKTLSQWHVVALGAGAFCTFSLGGYGIQFKYFTIPFSSTYGFIGLYLTLNSYLKSKPENKSFFHLASYVLFALYFMGRLTFPFWRLNPDVSFLGNSIEIFFLIGFAGTCLSTYLEMMRQQHELNLQEVLKDRSEKFLGQSKFSELGMMSAGIAHEINNPLAVIQARTTQLLRIYRNSDKQTELGDGLSQILHTSERISRTIQGIREFVHQDENGLPENIVIKQLFDDVLSFCGQRMKNHGVNLRFYGLEKFSVNVNKIQLEQVILNLLNNSFDAIEYLPDKWIEVSANESGDKVQIYFQDSGKGIPPEIATRIMEPFFTTKEAGKGTGLGLALATGIVEKHRGTIKYIPDRAHTTFLLELPKLIEKSDWGMPLH